MHSNPSFRREPDAKSLDAARAHGIGSLCLNGDAGPMMSHIPFWLDESGTRAEAHLTRSNPILKALEVPQPALIAVTKGAAYISPDWYGIEDQVPTLNYIAIHLRGTLSRCPQDSLKAHLDRLSARFEGQFDKVPWTSDKMSEGVMDKMMRAIVPVVLDVTDVQATWKLNQNKPDAVRLAAADHVSDPVISAAMKEA